MSSYLHHHFANPSIAIIRAQEFPWCHLTNPGLYHWINKLTDLQDWWGPSWSPVTRCPCVRASSLSASRATRFYLPIAAVRATHGPYDLFTLQLIWGLTSGKSGWSEYRECAASFLEDKVLLSKESWTERVTPKKRFFSVEAGLTTALSAPLIYSFQLRGEDDSVGHITLHGAY